MPVYEFECKDCKTIFEELILNSREKIVCKKCNSAKIERIISACGIISSKGKSDYAGGASSSSSCSTCSTHNCSTCR